MVLQSLSIVLLRPIFSQRNKTEEEEVEKIIVARESMQPCIEPYMFPFLISNRTTGLMSVTRHELLVKRFR